MNNIWFVHTSIILAEITTAVPLCCTWHQLRGLESSEDVVNHTWRLILTVSWVFDWIRGINVYKPMPPFHVAPLRHGGLVLNSGYIPSESQMEAMLTLLIRFEGHAQTSILPSVP